jgi:hypothetical protein
MMLSNSLGFGPCNPFPGYLEGEADCDLVDSKGYLTMVYAVVFRVDDGFNSIYGFIQL